MKQHYDILIIGAGIVGTSLALALAHLPLRIAILEKTPFSDINRTNLPGKPIALNYASYRILQTLLSGSDLATYAVPIKTVHISEESCFAVSRITAQEMGVAALGYVISSTHLAHACINSLLHVARESAKECRLTLINPGCCQALTKKEHTWEVQLTTEQSKALTITTPLVIAADGSDSVVRQLLGIPIQRHPDEPLALVTRLQLARYHDQIAYQRFTKQAIAACLPLLENQVGFIYTATKTAIEELQSLTEAEFLARLQQFFAYRLGKFLARDSLHVYPIKRFITESQAQAGLVLLGNAAHTLSPIAAQGLNLALHDMAEFANIVTQTVRSQQSLADPCIGQQYLAARLAIQKQLIGFTENLASWFKQKFPPLTLLRNSGLFVFDCVYPVKHNVAQRLMGIHGRLPPLIRGFIH
jgi:2-octaprenyl-6-methoxyphenol hydroxylase